jgi:hypothetical protein
LDVAFALARQFSQFACRKLPSRVSSGKDANYSFLAGRTCLLHQLQSGLGQDVGLLAATLLGFCVLDKLSTTFHMLCNHRKCKWVVVQIECFRHFAKNLIEKLSNLLAYPGL